MKIIAFIPHIELGHTHRLPPDIRMNHIHNVILIISTISDLKFTATSGSSPTKHETFFVSAVTRKSTENETKPLKIKNTATQNTRINRMCKFIQNCLFFFDK